MEEAYIHFSFVVTFWILPIFFPLKTLPHAELFLNCYDLIM